MVEEKTLKKQRGQDTEKVDEEEDGQGPEHRNLEFKSYVYPKKMPKNKKKQPEEKQRDVKACTRARRRDGGRNGGGSLL